MKSCAEESAASDEIAMQFKNPAQPPLSDPMCAFAIALIVKVSEDLAVTADSKLSHCHAVLLAAGPLCTL